MHNLWNPTRVKVIECIKNKNNYKKEYKFESLFCAKVTISRKLQREKAMIENFTEYLLYMLQKCRMATIN